MSQATRDSALPSAPDAAGPLRRGARESGQADAPAPVAALAAMLAVQVMVSLAVVTVPVVAPAAAQAMAVSANLVGIFVAMVYAAGMASSLFSGAFVRRFGAVRVSQACSPASGWRWSPPACAPCSCPPPSCWVAATGRSLRQAPTSWRRPRRRG